MKKINISIIFLLTFLNVWSQKLVDKDTLYFKFSCNYITVKENYENNHFFRFKNKKLVTSAFNGIVKETFFYFGQSGPPILYDFNPEKVFNLKKYLKKRPSIFRDKSTKQLDAYKIMVYFDRYVVFFLKDKKYIKVRAVPSLGE